MEIRSATKDLTLLLPNHSQVDVRNYENVQDMVEQTIKKYQRIDVLVCKCSTLALNSVDEI